MKNEAEKIDKQQGNGVLPHVRHSIFCDDCGEEIQGLYEDNNDGTYTCVGCLIKRDDGYCIDNEMGCDW